MLDDSPVMTTEVDAVAFYFACSGHEGQFQAACFPVVSTDAIPAINFTFFLFSHLADAFIQSNLQIRKSS